MNIRRLLVLTALLLIVLSGCASPAPLLFPESLSTNTPGRAPEIPAATPTALVLSLPATITPSAARVDTPAPGNLASPTEAGKPAAPTAPTIVPVPLPPNDALAQAMIARRNADYSRAAQLLRALLQSKPAPDLAREAQFRLAEVNYLDGAYANAIPLLAAFANENPGDPRAPLVRFFWADCLAQQKKYAEAIAQLQEYRKATETLAGDTDAQIAEWMAALGDTRGAVKQFDAALGDTTLSASDRVAYLERAADLHLKLGEPGLAATRYAAAFDAAQSDALKADAQYRWGLALAQANEIELAVTHWRTAVNGWPAQAGAHNALIELVNRDITVDDVQRGLVNFYNRSYPAAISALTRALDAPHGPVPVYYLALSYERNADARAALPQLDELIKSYPSDTQTVEAYYARARVLASLDRIDDAVAAYQTFAQKFPADARADDGLLQAGWLLDKKERRTDAAALFFQAQSLFPKGDKAPEGLFYSGFEYFLQKDYENATSRWQSLSAQYPASSQRQNALYWIGKVASMQGNAAAAQQAWKQASTGPRTFWGWRAADQLKLTSTPKLVFAVDDGPAARTAVEKWLISWTPALSNMVGLANLPASVESNVNFRRGVELRALDRSVEARRQFDLVNTIFQNDPRALYALSLYYHRNDLYSVALQSARRLFTLSPNNNLEELPKLIQQWIYPAAFPDLVVPQAEKYGFDAAMLFGLIRQESGFNPQATSSASARGLGQVMPATGQGIANQLGLRDYETLDLYRPVISVQFGAYYLAQNLKSFGNNTFYAFMAYNAGPGNAAKWKNDDLDVAIENVTLSETFTYVRAVYSQYRDYQIVYGK